jgi:radical SAM/Cys-rich protein
MFNTMPLLKDIPFPPIRRGRLDTLQVNVGYRCNQSCTHCHVAAGPHRREEMNAQTIDLVLAVLQARAIATLDITGGAPELNPHFRRLVCEARQLGVRVLDRCNLTVLELPDQSDLAEFLKANRVEILASMPCYLKDNVDGQRGKGVFETSIRVLQRLNALGYGSITDLVLNLVYNPQGPSLPPPQAELEADYRRVLGERYGIVFNHLYTLANMPIQRFGALLKKRNEMEAYLALLRTSYRHDNLQKVMCHNLISVDWRGYLYDCDFNQMLEMPMAWGDHPHLSDLLRTDVTGNPIRVAGHCFGCTAGQGSSCGGALQAPASEMPAVARQNRAIDEALMP